MALLLCSLCVGALSASAVQRVAQPCARYTPRTRVRMIDQDLPDVSQEMAFDMPEVSLDWSNKTTVSATNRIDALLSASRNRLSALESGEPVELLERRRRVDPAPPDDPAETAALLDNLRRRLAGELEIEHETDIVDAIKMARLWPSPKRQLDELLRVRTYVSFLRTPLSLRYHVALATAFDAVGQTERARTVRRQAGLAANGDAISEASGSTPAGSNPEMVKLFDMTLPSDPW